ncbi:MAG: hypothetical protein AB7H80_14850 [Candidatus Kapaibacterium sp.]
MRRNSLILLPFIATLLCGASLYAQGGSEAEPAPEPELQAKQERPSLWQFGIYGGGALASNSAEFVTLPGVISCQGDSILYTGGSGGGIQFAGVVGMQPAPAEDFLSHVGWSVKASFYSTSSSFETEERIGQSISPTGELSPIISRYVIDAGLTTLAVEPTLLYQFSRNVPIIVGIGPTAGLLLGATYDQKEEVASPSGATFADGRSERNVRSGDLEESNSLNLGGTITIGYNIQITPLISLRPEIGGTLSFTDPVPNVSWTQNLFRGGISLLFNPASKESNPLGPTLGR